MKIVKLLTILIVLFSLIILITFSSLLVTSGYVDIPEASFLGLRISEASGSLFDKPSPGNWIQDSQIIVYQDRIVILVPDAIKSFYANTKSMDPTMDFTANGIEIEPESPEQIQVGDIIVFKPDLSKEEYIVHRVIEIGTDSEGWYCITKGDNAFQDDGKIRWEQVEAVTIAIFY